MTKKQISSILLWSLTVLFFAIQFILRLSPSSLKDELIIYYNIDIEIFSTLAAFYYLGYAGMQIPVGMMLDKYGIRYVVSTCIFICVLGNTIFVTSSYWPIALFGRFLIGVGSAAGVLGAVKAVRVNFKHELVSKMIGWTVTFGLIGAITAGSLNLYLKQIFGWKNATLLLNAPGIIIAILILAFVKDHKGKESDKISSKQSILISLIEVLKNPQLLMLGIFGALLVGPLESFADLWGTPFFEKNYGFSPEDSSLLSSSMIYFGMCVGSPTLAWVVEKFKISYYMNIFCGLLMALIFYLLLNKLILNYHVIMASMFIVGILCAYQVIVFAIATDLAPAKLTGMTISVINMINMGAGALFHFAIGRIIMISAGGATGEIINGKTDYPAEAYSDALFILPITLIIGSIGFFLIKPKGKDI